ncbi:cytochrome c, class I [Luminiphilus syltensis NOR5-1B]|uniref:Cytochrome c, class I n=1 Tax=Luminiphilus syltensis NOR5-1B TaxID=565045 RepID=B8KT69_9GAMM|nr:cytochrome c, class I [Luminiphilus syltensis NOR5-1B]
MCVAAFSGMNPALAEAPAAVATCVGCHGQDGISVNPEWPNLGGQYADYLALQLKAYRDGTRKNVLMQGIAGGLTDDDIAALAEYYAAQPVHIAANGEASLVSEGQNRAGYCKACHGMKGYPVASEWPVLAGQNAAYFAAQLAAFKSMERIHPAMQAVAKDLKPSHMDALAAYYSQLTPDQD